MRSVHTNPKPPRPSRARHFGHFGMEALLVAPLNPDEGQANPNSSLVDSARALWFGPKPSASSTQMRMTSASDIFRDATLIDDPRWDEKGFNEFSGMHARFVSLAYVKGIKDGRFTPSRGRADVDGAQFHDLRDDKLRHAGKTRDKVGLFAVLSATSFDYTGELSNVGEAIRKVEAAEIVKIVESKKGGGKDDDLIMWDFLCVDKADDGAKRGMYRMFTHYRVQTVILTKPPGVHRSVFERLETMAMLALVAFCQRIVNLDNEDVKKGLNLDNLMDLPNLLAPLQSDHKTFLRVASTLEAVIKHLKPVAEDEKGFKVLCSEGDIAWVKATYLKELQRAMPTDGGRPFPRRQDLDQSKLFTGEPPKRKAIVVSHGWDTAFHISPSGEKLDLLVDALERVDAMTDDDGVFIDFCSLPQAAHASMPSIYFQHNGIKTYADKSALEKKQFNFAMWDMSRMYAYSYVIVLPKPTDITKFPGDTSAPLLAKDMKLVLDGEDVLVEGTDPRIVIQYCVKNGKAKTDGSQSFILDRDLAFADNVEFPVGSLKVVLSNVCGWGRVSPLPYQNRGWCCSEFTMALYNRRILNTKDVAQLTYMDSGRPWPKTVAEYDQMMRSGVEFTKRGDADLVKFLFFRMCFGLRHSFFPFEVQDTTGYALPSEADLMAASREGQVGTGVNDQSKYYLYLALQPPAVQLDGRIWKRSLAQKLHRMQLLMIAKAPHWTGHGHHPVAFGIGDREMTESDLRRGGIHCLVWCSTGCGWETPKPSSDHKSLSIPGLCEVLTSLELTKRPAVIFVVMPYGARRAADQLAYALAGGSTLVVWIAENMLDEQRANGVLFGVLAPALQSLHEPWINDLSPSELTSEVLHKSGQMVFGSQWDAADCLDVSTTVPQLRWAPSSLPQDRPWVHNLTSSFEGMALPRDGAVQTRRMMGTDDDKGEQRYLEVQLIVRENGKEIDVPQLFAREDGQTPEIVFAWLAKALPNGDAKNVTALYSHEVKRASGGWMSTLQVRLMIGEVGYLHQLRDLALTGAPSILEKELSSALLDGRRYEVSVDRAQFALSYEESVLSLDKLTVHQKEKLRECYGTAESNPLHRLLRRSQELFDGTATPSYIHVEAPAGAGKTFVALNYLLSRLQSHPTMTALYVARNRALCLFFVRWIIKREPNPLNRLGLLRRLQVLFEGDEREPPFALGPQRVMLKNGVIQVESSHSDTHNFSLTIVDEAHHIYTNPLCRECVGAYVLPPTEARHLMLLSDISQSSGKDKELYPKGKPKVVTLTEVVRSSQRIVEAASVFQLGDSVHKISCQHSAAGPPLKAFMFNLEGAVPDAVPLMKDLNDGQVRQYAGQTVEAIKHIISMFGSLRLHDRVAIVVDVDILNDFRGTFSAGAYQGGLLGAELLEHFMRRESATKQQIEAGHARSFQIIDATQAASMVMGGSQDDREWLIVDTIEAFDGLERLVVIAVGLDAKIVQGDKTLKTRSLLYRAMTRAHMLAIVVQHNIPGGFFAFLHQVKLDPSAEFDAAKAQKARDSTALNKVMTKGKASSATEQAEMTVPSLSTAVRSLFSRLVGKVEVNFPALSTTVRSLFSRLVGKASSAVAGSDAAADRAALEAGEKKVATLYLTTLGHLICASLLLAKWESLEDLNGGPLNGTRFDSLPTHDAPGLSWFSVFVPSWIAELIVVGMAIWSVMLLPSTARNLRIQHINTIAQTILCALFQLLLAIRLTTQRGSWLVVFSPWYASMLVQVFLHCRKIPDAAGLFRGLRPGLPIGFRQVLALMFSIPMENYFHSDYLDYSGPQLNYSYSYPENLTALLLESSTTAVDFSQTLTDEPMVINTVFPYVVTALLTALVTAILTLLWLKKQLLRSRLAFQKFLWVYSTVVSFTSSFGLFFRLPEGLQGIVSARGVLEPYIIVESIPLLLGCVWLAIISFSSVQRERSGLGTRGASLSSIRVERVVAEGGKTSSNNAGSGAASSANACSCAASSASAGSGAASSASAGSGAASSDDAGSGAASSANACSCAASSASAGNGAASSASAGSGAASSDNAGSGAASSASAGSGAAHGEKNLTKQTIWDTSSIEESEEVEAGSVELNPFAAAKTTEGIDAPIEAALRDGAVRLIDVAWLLDSDRSDKQLPRVTKVVARLASNEPTDVLIRQLAKLCGTSSICITVEAASAASPPPSPPPSPPEVAAPAEVQLERFRHELAEAGLSQLAHAIIDDLGIESVEGLCDFTFNELKERLKAEAGVTLDLGHSQKLKAFLAASPSGTSEERMAGGPKVAFSAHGLQPDAKRRCSTKHADAKLTRSLTSSAMLRAQVKNAEAGEGDVESPHLDTSSAASSLGSGRFHSRRRRDSFAEDLTMEAASKSEHPSGKMTARAVVSAKLRRQNETRLPKPGALGSGRMDHNHGIGLEDLDSRPAPFERGASATRKTPNGQLDAHEKSFVVTFHLSTFAEVAPLTAAGLCRKAEAVKERLAELGAEDINIVMGKPFLPRCQDMPPEAFLSPERAADLYARGRRGVYVSSCCWRTSDLPDPDGRTLEKLRGYMKGRHGEYGLFVDFACTPQIFAWPSWHAPEAISRRFGAEVSQGPLTVLKFECERVATEVEAQVCVDKLVSLCSQQGWALASMADFESLGLHSRDYGSALFHGRYVRGAYRFDEDEEALPAEGYVRFRTEGDARAAWRHPELKRLCGGKEPELMGEHVFENELKFKRGLSVMGSLYASATGTCVLQLTDPPGKLDHDGAPSELVSERTGTVFVVRTNTSLEELRKELGDGVLAWEKKGWGEFVVRVAGETAARAVRSLNERGYPLRRKDRVVYPMYNLRPYRSRGWPVFDTAVASIVVAYVTQHKRQGKPLPDLVARAEASSPKFINIDVIGAPRVVEVTQSPERLLRACIEKLSSNRIVFTGNVQLRQVSSFVQLLSDLEASIAVEVTGSAPAPLRSPRSQNMVLAENMMNFISS